MPVNLELKIKLNSIRGIKSLLKKNNIELKEILNQKDIYYKIKAGSLLKLRIENGRMSLIKYNREEKKKNRWSDFYVITIKGRATEKVFEEIFRVDAIVEKKRELYLFLDTRIHIDAVKNLGFFLELETLVFDNDKKDAKKRFDEVVNTLQLDVKSQIRKSYRDLIIQNKK